MKILVVGCGSIGKRHINNLSALGVDSISVVDPREERRKEIETNGVSASYATVTDAVANDSFDAAVVANPTGLHIVTATELASHGIHVFIEKPLDKDLEQISKLQALVDEQSLVTMMGFCLRFSASGKRIKEVVASEAIGRLLALRGVYSSYLPNWHPYEDYRSFYMAKKELGGGALLDECHLLDFAQFLGGRFTQVYADVGKISDLEIETDDCFDIIASTEQGVRCNLHGNIFSQPAHDSITAIGTKGTVRWDVGPDEVTLQVPSEKHEETHKASEDRNQMYIAEMNYFLELISNNSVDATLDLAHGVRLQQLLIDARNNSGSSPFSLE